MTTSSMRIAFFGGSSHLAVELMQNGARGSVTLNANSTVQCVVRISWPALRLHSLIVRMILEILLRMQFSYMIVMIFSFMK